MGTLISLFGALLLFFLTLSGLLLIVAPALGRRMLHKTAVFAGLFIVLLVALNVLWQMVHSINPSPAHPGCGRPEPAGVFRSRAPAGPFEAARWTPPR